MTPDRSGSDASAERRGRIGVAVVWFFGLGGLGVFLPYYSLYLHENAGLTGTQVGRVLAMLPLAGIFAQPFWGQVSDLTGSRTRVLGIVALGTSLLYLPVGIAGSFAALLVATACLAFFSNALIPNGVAVTLAIARDAGPNAFGLLRVWGTVGFLCAVVSFPWVLDAVQSARGLASAPGGPSEPGLELLFCVASGSVLVAALVAFGLPRHGAVALRAESGDWRRLVRHGPYLRLLVFTLLTYACLQGPMAIFPVFVRAQGGTLDSVSHMWILMLSLEIPLVAASGATLTRLGPRGLLAMGVIAGGLRWTICGFAPDLRWVYAAQLLHGVVVAGFVIGAPLYVDASVPERLRSSGQHGLAMFGIGIGAITSNLAAGWLLEHVGPEAPYRLGGVLGLALGCLVPFALPPPRRPEPPDAVTPATGPGAAARVRA